MMSLRQQEVLAQALAIRDEIAKSMLVNQTKIVSGTMSAVSVSSLVQLAIETSVSVATEYYRQVTGREEADLSDQGLFMQSSIEELERLAPPAEGVTR